MENPNDRIEVESLSLLQKYAESDCVEFIFCGDMSRVTKNNIF